MKRQEERGEDHIFSVWQIRNKSNKIAAACKNASITMKAKSDFNQFQDQNEYRKWFTILFPLKAWRNQPTLLAKH